MFQNLILATVNFIKGSWNNVGILGRILLLCLAPLAALILLILHSLKLGGILLTMLFGEVSFYFAQWRSASSATIRLLDELLSAKVVPSLTWLFEQLLGSTTWTGAALQPNWLRQLVISLLGQLYFVFAFVLLGLSGSSILYSILIFGYGVERNWMLVCLTRVLLFLPVLHKWIRCRMTGIPFTFSTLSPSLTSRFSKRQIFVAMIISFLLVGVGVGAYFIYKYQLLRRGESFFEQEKYNKAFTIYEQNQFMLNPKQMYQLGRLYGHGQGVTQNYKEAVKWYKKAAEQNNVDAQYDFGLMYKKGLGVIKNDTVALKWFRKAAEQNHVDGQNNLGRMYYYGFGVIKDYIEALKWYRKAAEQNNIDAQYMLGYMYYYGQGVTSNYTETLKWFRKAAEQNYVDAQYMLGYMYYYGQGVTSDYTEAVKWFRKAAEQNKVDAQYRLGYMYETEQGVTQDYTEALKWYRKAAEQNHVSSQKNLAQMYRIGKGVPIDSEEAEKWEIKAAGQ